MILKNCRYSELAERIKAGKNRVVVYGAGMVGQIVAPYFIQAYGLQEYVECYVDMDRRKEGKTVWAGNHAYQVRHPDFLREPPGNPLILVTNSRFHSAINYLDCVRELDSVEGYIIPLMQIWELNWEEPPAIRRLDAGPAIPRKIHYCWFGKKKMPEFLLRCMGTWKRHCPDYEILCWNEDNYDIGRIPYVKEAYEKKQYGFVTDAARLDILYSQGGIYMDTDVSLMRGLDELLYQPAFAGVERWGNINTGGLAGAVPGHPMIKEMLEYRKQFRFVLENGSLNMETNGVYETVPFIRRGMRVDNSLQQVNGMTVYPSSVFHPYDYMSCEEKVEEWTFSKHHFYGGWMDGQDIEERRNTQGEYRRVIRRIRLGGKPDDG